MTAPARSLSAVFFLGLLGGHPHLIGRVLAQPLYLNPSVHHGDLRLGQYLPP